MILNDILEIESVRFEPKRNEEHEGLGSGEILRAELTTPLWSARVVSPLTEFNSGRRLRALVNKLSNPGEAFELYDPIARFPQSDPDGSILGASSVTILDNVDGKIRLQGLPVGYVLSVGDYFHVDKGLTRYFYEISEDVTADALGNTVEFEIFPKASSALLANDAVQLLTPTLKAQFEPGSIEYGTVQSSTWKMSGFSFMVVQKI